MELVITAGDETGDLSTWLARENDLRGYVRSRPGPLSEHTLAAEVVIIAAIAAVSALARSICGYLIERERARRTDLEFAITRKSGNVDHFVVNGTTDPLRLVELLLGEDGPSDQIGDGDSDASSSAVS
ncbi:effector-associated constant component EACC1 [Actinophytocola xinjiangensis]|uniref:effector-associated constant component EACC1 n=1 Tax=Actinophytocola xinjiangensis TaxID=485602 RepID=UPI000B093B97|nr:hypothetical protein [Actinophytocola xinjiangensis]